MKNYKEVIERNGKDSSFYLPVINVLKKSKNPLTIKEIANLLGITYSATKPRLHKLERWSLIQRLKRGYYSMSGTKDNITKISKVDGKPFFLKGCIRIMGSSNGVWITIYNSKFGEMNNGQYCIIENFNGEEIIIRKSNQFMGNKLYFLISKSVGVSIPRKEIPVKLISRLSTKAIPIKIGIYLDEWDVSLQDLFSTESVEDGQLANALNKFGSVRKPSKFDNLKSDIIFGYKNKEIPIEITTTKPSFEARQPQHRMSSIKASQILMRFYFSIKWNYLRGLSTVIVLHRDWEEQAWMKKERAFMKNFKCHIIFSDFSENWAHKSALEIKRLIEASFFNKTTLLAIE